MYHNQGYTNYKMSKVKSSDWKHLQFDVFNNAFNNVFYKSMKYMFYVFYLQMNVLTSVVTVSDISLCNRIFTMEFLSFLLARPVQVAAHVH